MEQIPYTLAERLHSFGLGILGGAVAMAAVWGVVVVAWAAAA